MRIWAWTEYGVQVGAGQICAAADLEQAERYAAVQLVDDTISPAHPRRVVCRDVTMRDSATLAYETGEWVALA